MKNITETQQILCNNIKNLRLHYNWNQEKVAKRLGISIAAFSKIEKGYTDINISRVEQIAIVFEVNIIELFRMKDIEKITFAMVFSHSELAQINNKLVERNLELSNLEFKVAELSSLIQKNNSDNKINRAFRK